MFPIDVLLTEDELAEGWLAALERRTLPEKFFYWSPLSVKAWLELCQGEQPYKNFSRSYQLVSRHAAEVAGQTRAHHLEVVSLGAGQGDKDLLLLEALRASGATLRYRPVDSSQALLELALRRAAAAGFAVRGLKADLKSAPTAAALAASSDERRLYLLLGNTLGGLDPLELLGTLRGLVRPDDRVLVDGEIFNAAETLAAYDNPVNRRFAFGPLASLGLEEGRDGVLVFDTGTDPRRPGLYLVTKHFRAARRLGLLVAGRRLELAAGETIAMDGSYKYSRAAFGELLASVGGLRPLAEYASDDRHFLMVLAAPAGK